MPIPSSHALRRPLLVALTFAGCALFAIPLSAAPIRPAAVQERIDRQVAFQRAQHGDLLALRRDLPRSRSEQQRLDRTHTPGRSRAARTAPIPGDGRHSVQGGGPPSALYAAFDDDRAIGEGYLAKFDVAGLPAPGWPAFGLPVIAGAQVATDHRSVDDGAGGRIVGWIEYGIGVMRIRTQRISDAGIRLWGATGVPISPNYDDDLAWEMLPDDAGGVFFAWEATAAGEPVIRVQHVNGAGSIATDWPATGVALGAAGTAPVTPMLARDGMGGVCVTWMDLNTLLIYAQYLDGSAISQYSPPEGRPLSFVAEDYAISPDAGSGLTLTWGSLDTQDIFVERLDSGGAPTWGDSGVVVCASPSAQAWPQIQPDGSGGFMVAWSDWRETPPAVYAQRLDSNGAPLSSWPVNGARVGGSDLGQFSWISDGLGGAFVALFSYDYYGTGHWRIALQHTLSTGDVANNFGADGLAVATRATDEVVTMFLDGGGGVLAAWFEPEERFGIVGRSLFGQRIDIGGSLAWGGGSPLRLSPAEVGRQSEPSLIEGGQGGARVGFEQFNGPATGLDAGFKRVNQNGAPQGSTVPVAYGSGEAGVITLVPDSPNRVIALWAQRLGPSPRLFAQRYSNLGAPLWAPGGVEIERDFGSFGLPKIPAIPDGASGVIVGWIQTDVMLQRIDSTGAVRWGATGTSAFTGGAFGSSLLSDRSIQPAEGNGAFVAGLMFGPVNRWCVQKVDGDGNRLWGPNGTEYANDSLRIAAVFEGGIASDGQGGVYAAWQHGILSTDPVHTIRITRLESSGALAPGWPAEGIEVCGRFESAQLTGIAPDGLGNAIVTWMENRTGHLGAYAQRINSAGIAQWDTAGASDLGVAFALDNGAQIQPQVDTDGAGGAVFAWLDGRGSSWDIYAQRITSDGLRAWGSGGLGVCTAAGPQGQLALASDGSSGALLAWADGRTLPTDLIEIARVTGAGVLPWSANGVVSTLASLQSAQVVGGVARLAWTTSDPQFHARLERRTANEGWSSLGDVVADGTGWIRAEDASVERGGRYGYRLVATIDGAEQPLDEVWLDVPSTLAFALHGMRPNPANGPLTVSFALPKNAPARLEVMDVAGRRVYSREVGSLGAGSHVLNLGEPAAMGPGLYFLRLTQGKEQREVRFTRVR